MFGFCPLASGSKGNCLYVGSKTTRILIDAGISAKAISERLQKIQVDLHTIQAVIITHEHSDHTKGLLQLAKKFHIPVLANAETAKAIYANFKERLRFKIFTTGEAFEFGDLTIHPFSIPHDTLDPVAFTIQIGPIKLGVCADLGYVTSLVRKMLENCHYLYLEANHQISMVHASRRPEVLKQRILGKQGHLSNEDCAKTLAQIFHPGLKHVYLSHLSGECNNEQTAIKTVGDILKSHQIEVNLSVAKQEEISLPICFHA